MAADKWQLWILLKRFNLHHTILYTLLTIASMILLLIKWQNILKILISYLRQVKACAKEKKRKIENKRLLGCLWKGLLVNQNKRCYADDVCMKD